MRTVVKRWGKSAVVQIPSNLLRDAKIEIDDPVDIREEQGRIMIVPLRSASYDLADLLERITPSNLHGASDFGRPIGREQL